MGKTGMVKTWSLIKDIGMATFVTKQPFSSDLLLCTGWKNMTPKTMKTFKCFNHL